METTDSISNKVKNFLKRWPGVYNWLKKVLGPDNSPGNRYELKRRINQLMAGDLHDKVVLNLGSGTNRIHPKITNVDLFPFKEVDLVADISNLPMQDQTVDGIVCGSVLEHIASPAKVLAEMARVLKPGGTLILTVPFLYPYHSSPGDYFRWTHEGIALILKENSFHIEDRGICGGPMGALQGLLMHILAITFSFGSKTLYFFLTQVFMVILAPLKILDLFFLLFPYSVEIASDIFVIAKKK